MRASLTKVAATIAASLVMLSFVGGGVASAASVYPGGVAGAPPDYPPPELPPPYPAAPGQNFLSWAWQNSVLVVGDSLCALSMTSVAYPHGTTTNWTPAVFGPLRSVDLATPGGSPTCEVSQDIPWGVSQLQLELTQSEQAGGAPPPTVVLALGTNSNLQCPGQNCANGKLAFMWWLQGMINAAEALNPNEQVFVVNYSTIDGYWPQQNPAVYSPANTDTKNQILDFVLSQDQASNPNLHLVDWHTESASWSLCTGDTDTRVNFDDVFLPITSNPMPCFVDGVHGDEAFWLARTELIANTIQSFESSS